MFLQAAAEGIGRYFSSATTASTSYGFDDVTAPQHAAWPPTMANTERNAK
jgi:hypothetical protein